MKSSVFVLLLFVLLLSLSSTAQILSNNNSTVYSNPYTISGEQAWLKADRIWSRNNYRTYVRLSDGQLVYGQVIFAAENGFFLQMDTLKLYNPFNDAKVRYIDYTDVKQLQIRNFWRNKSGRKKGALIGTSGGFVLSLFGHLATTGMIPFYVTFPASLIGITIPAALIGESYFANKESLQLNKEQIDQSGLKAYAYFPDKLPVSIRQLNETLHYIDTLPSANQLLNIYANAPNLKKVFAPRKFSISVLKGYTYANRYVENIWNSNDNRTKVGFSFSYHLNERHALMFEHVKFSQNELINETSGSVITSHMIHNTSTILYQYNFLHRTDFQINRWEMGIRTGAIFNELENMLFYNNHSGGYQQITNKTNLIGWKLDLNASYYLSPYLSVSTGFGRNMVGKQHVPAIYEVKAYEQETSVWQWLFSIGYHF